jgi:hypothetical protein
VPAKPHRDFFKLYALDTEVTVKPRAARPELLRATDGRALDEGQAVGTFQRKG